MNADSTWVLLGILWAMLTGKGSAPRVLPAPSTEPERELPPARGERTSTPPWPSVTPSGLPPFPGRGWEYDEPPPAAVQARARALRAELWRRGKGSHVIEQTAGRWIAYRSEITRGGKQGVVAYRERRAAPSSPPLPGTTAQRAPSSPGAVPVSFPVTDGNVVTIHPGVAYETTAEIDTQASPELLRSTLERGGMSRVTVLSESPVVVRFDSPPARVETRVPVGVWIEQLGIRLRIVQIKPITPSVSPMRMPTLRRGSNGPDVALVQRKLGIPEDGKFGPGTNAAVLAYQRSHGLVPDGVVGPQTWTQLFGTVT